MFIARLEYWRGIDPAMSTTNCRKRNLNKSYSKSQYFTNHNFIIFCYYQSQYWDIFQCLQNRLHLVQTALVQYISDFAAFVFLLLPSAPCWKKFNKMPKIERYSAAVHVVSAHCGMCRHSVPLAVRLYLSGFKAHYIPVFFTYHLLYTATVYNWLNICFWNKYPTYWWCVFAFQHPTEWWVGSLLLQCMHSHPSVLQWCPCLLYSSVTHSISVKWQRENVTLASYTCRLL